MRFQLIFGPLGPCSRSFTGRFVFFSRRQVLAQMEARMTHFVTLTVASPRTDHCLRHSTTRVGLRAGRVRILFFRENVRFGRFSWAIAHGFGTRTMCHSGFHLSKYLSSRKGNEMTRKRPRTWTQWSKNQLKPHKLSCTSILWQSGRFPKNWPGCRKPCVIAHENRPERTFSEKNKIRTRLARRSTLVVRCLKLWSVRGGGPFEWRNVSSGFSLSKY
jgi:hypothetical protein